MNYCGGEDFTSNEAFSGEWKYLFEYLFLYFFRHFPSTDNKQNDTCNCNKDVTKKNYFKKWPKYLFAVTTSQAEILRNAARHNFQIGTEYDFITNW